jgi:DNA (cytosine-5)-methyltransferase 1
MIKVLNLYAGIGGNRKLWGNVDVVAVELNPEIAKIYQDFFKNDKVIVADAHQYLLEHFREYDFIWSSPPCPSHSKINRCFTYGNATNPIIYADMKLYEEIILLREYVKFPQKYVIENVVSYYKPLILPQEVAKHYFWSNFYIRTYRVKNRENYGGIDNLTELKGFNINNYKKINKVKVLRNCVEPELGLHIFQEAFKDTGKQEILNFDT